MKKLIIITLLSVSVLHASIGADKYKHAYVGIGIYAGCMVLDKVLSLTGHDIGLNAKTCLIPVVTAGVGKEIYDMQHENHTADILDTVSTVAIPLGAVTLYQW